MRHIYSCPLRWSDMDAFGHVNNVVFLRYLEEARIDFMFRLRSGLGVSPAERGKGSTSFTGGSVVARHEIDYLRPLVHRHAPVTVETWVTKIGAASLTLAYEVKDEEQVYVRATTIVVPYNLAEGRPRRITGEERGFLERYFDDGAVGGGADGVPDEDAPGERAEEAVAV
ncbi:acyl-CoA thioesterase [Streptomyces sp. KR80]|uniref:acyl-CoA thioesterase n=1 Tax=Streptomyces sp. KR80 TaxID=3457426 RepID=UPI003FD3BCAE